MATLELLLIQHRKLIAASVVECCREYILSFDEVIYSRKSACCAA